MSTNIYAKVEKDAAKGDIAIIELVMDKSRVRVLRRH